MAQLVIADAAYKSYPGRVIVARCADHMGAARGTLSDEADALANSGQAVREQQQINNIIGTGTFASYGAADDTLVLEDVPLKTSVGFYSWMISYRIEGYLDVTDGVLLRACSNESYNGAYVIGMHGAGTSETEASPQAISILAPELPHYRMAQFIGAFEVEDDNPTLTFRAYSEDGTTIEILLDYIAFFPSGFTSGDIVDLEYNSLATTPVVDGADGGGLAGDDFGKFTLTPDPPLAEATSDPGDFQKYEDGDDAEYAMHIHPDDGFQFIDADEVIPGHLYSLHVAGYRGERTWTEDFFTRDTSGPGGMGISPEGFGYAVGTTGETAFCNGSVGVVQVNSFDGVIQLDFGGGIKGTDPYANNGAQLQLYDQFDWSGIFTFVDDTGVDEGIVTIIPFDGSSDLSVGMVEVRVHAKTWRMYEGFDLGIFTEHDISSWFDLGTPVGFRVKIDRYKVRWRIWDASGAEPSTWDHEFFMHIFEGTADDNYPYDDDLGTSKNVIIPIEHLIFVVDNFESLQPGPFSLIVHIDNFKVEHDPYGDPDDMSTRVENPQGSVVDDIVVPFGAPYLVYWGSRVWTEFSEEFEANYLSFSTKLWNDPSSALIQRAEARWWWFLFAPGGIVSMNWRSADRKSTSRRILTAGS
jgi:hypothetical protein